MSALIRHAEFLTRAAEDGRLDSISRRGQAAFLALRVVDQLAGAWRENVQAFDYQRSATTRYVTELEDPEHPENVRLKRVLASSSGESPRGPLLEALRDYAEYLGALGHRTEAVDVWSTLLDLGVGLQPPIEWVEPLQLAVHALVTLDRVNEGMALYRRALVALRGVSDVGVLTRARLARIELMAADGNEAAAVERAARRCLARVRRAEDVALEWAAALTLSRAFLTAKLPLEAAHTLGGIRGDRPAPSAVAYLDLAEALLDLGEVGLAADEVGRAQTGGLSETARFRSERISLEISARRGDEVGFARGIRAVGQLMDASLVAQLRRALGEAKAAT